MARQPKRVGAPMTVSGQAQCQESKGAIAPATGEAFIGPLMAWEGEEDEDRLLARTFHAVAQRNALCYIELYGDIFLRHG